jgi:hypothetical protein
MHLPDLHELLEYKNLPVLKLYAQNYPNNELSGEQAFAEVLKYLWLTRKHEIDLLHNADNENFPQACIMLRSMQEIDEMWHEFILFTQDYMDFCSKYFGGYMHHLPNIFDNAPQPRDEVERDIEKLLPYVYDNLGEETLRIWFSAYLNDNG